MTGESSHRGVATLSNIVHINERIVAAINNAQSVSAAAATTTAAVAALLALCMNDASVQHVYQERSLPQSVPSLHVRAPLSLPLSLSLSLTPLSSPPLPQPSPANIEMGDKSQQCGDQVWGRWWFCCLY